MSFALAVFVAGSSLAVASPPTLAPTGPIETVRLFGRLYFRPEVGFNRHDFDWDEADVDYIFTLRTNTGLDVGLPHDMHVVFDLQSYGTYVLQAGPLDPTINLYQGYLELRDMRNTPLDLIIGRFEEGPYGTGMLVAPDAFYDGFSLEGWRLRYDTERAVLDIVWSQLYAPSGDDEETWRNPVLFGTHDTVHLHPALSADAYLWWMVSKPFMGWKTQTYTLGGRVFGRTGDRMIVDYSVEGAWQLGKARGIADESATASIAAYALNPRVGLTVGPARFGAEYYRASGDDDLSDDVIRSFNTMWQDPHGRFGDLDLYTGSNLSAAILSVEARLADGPKPSRLGVDGYALSVLELADVASASVFEDGATPPEDASHAIGLGGDLWYTVPLTQEVSWQLNLSAMQPGALVSDTLGVADTQVRGTTTIEARF